MTWGVCQLLNKPISIPHALSRVFACTLLSLAFSATQAQATIEAAETTVDVQAAFDYGGDIYVTNFSGDPINLTESETHEMMPAWSHDGAQLAFLHFGLYSTWDGALLHILTLETNEVRRVSDFTLTSETELTWSPDEQYIAATSGTLIIIDVETGEARSIAETCGSCSVNWLADSSGLIFETRGEIFSIDRDGENLQQITHAPPNASQPNLYALSNDLIFVSSDNDAFWLYSINLPDATRHQIVDLSGYDLSLHYWSPDGQHIALGVFAGYGSTVDVPGGGDVYVVDEDGTNLRAVTGEGGDSLIGWANDSEHVIYYQSNPGGATGSYFAVNIFDGTQTRLSNDTMDTMCSYSNCRNFSVRPS